MMQRVEDQERRQGERLFGQLLWFFHCPCTPRRCRGYRLSYSVLSSCDVGVPRRIVPDDVAVMGLDKDFAAASQSHGRSRRQGEDRGEPFLGLLQSIHRSADSTELGI